MTGKREVGLPFGVRSYPCAERGPWLWVWMRKPELADPNKVPFPDLETRPDATLHAVQEVLFEQDAEPVRRMQAYIDEDVRCGRLEFSMAYDKFGVEMRGILRDMKKRELQNARLDDAPCNLHPHR